MSAANLGVAPADDQVSFDDLVTYRADLRRNAITTGLHAAKVGDPDGFELACQAIGERAATGLPFTSHDIPNIGSNAKGSAFRHMAQLGVITCEGFTTAKSQASHGHTIRVWRGVP